MLVCGGQIFKLATSKLSPWSLVKHNAFSSYTEGISQKQRRIITMT